MYTKDDEMELFIGSHSQQYILLYSSNRDELEESSHSLEGRMMIMGCRQKSGVRQHEGGSMDVKIDEGSFHLLSLSLPTAFSASSFSYFKVRSDHTHTHK
jgi:hypothetical protein